MSSWNNVMDFRSRKTQAAGLCEPRPRPVEPPGREMVGGLLACCLYRAARDYAKANGKSVTQLCEDMHLGRSTWDRMRQCRTISQATALKLVKHLGTDVRTVLDKYKAG